MTEISSLKKNFHSINGGALFIEEDWVISYANRAIVDWFKENEAIEGGKCFQVLFNREKPCERCPLSFHNKGGVKKEEIFLPLKLSSISLEVSCCSFWDEAKESGPRAVSFVWDSAESKKEDPLFFALMSIGDGVIITNREGSIYYMNPKAQELTGWSLKEAQGNKAEVIFQVFDILSSKSSQGPVEHVLETKKTLQVRDPQTLKRRDGSEIQISLSAAPIIGDDDHVRGAIIVFSDQSTVYQTRQALVESEKEKALILNSISESCVLYDLEKRVVWMNKKAEEILGSKGADLVGLPCYAAWFKQDRSCEECPMEIVLDEGKPNEGEVLTPDGNIFLVKGYPVFDGDRMTGFIELGMDITEEKKTERSLQETMEKLEMLHQTALKLSRAKRKEDLFALIVEEAKKLLPFSSCALYLREDLLLVAKAKTKGSPSIDLKVGEGIVGATYTKGEPLFISDLKEERGADPYLLEYTSLICLPVGDWGVFQALSRSRAFTKEDVRLLEILVTYGGEALSSIFYGSRVEHLSFHDHLTGLYNRNFLEEEMERLDVVGSLPISLIMLDINGLKLVNDTYGYRMGDNLLMSVAQNLKSSCRSDDSITRWGGDEFLIFLPCTSNDQAQRIAHRILETFEGAVIEGIPIQIALGTATKEENGEDIYRVLREAEDLMNRQKLTENRSARGKIISTLLKTLGEKSYETEEHAWRMQRMAIEVGEEIGLPPSELDRLSLLLTLHDIGKITIPEDILTKPGRLSKEEWEIVKRHPEVGARIAASSEEFAHVAAEILSHHERWDGKGYPNGLKGEEIPILARVTSIVDSFDVMTNERSYKKAMTKEEAIEELQRCAGAQFDADLVEVFIKLISSSR